MPSEFQQFSTCSMSEDESAKLWKVNRTIHELVKDRVRYSPNTIVPAYLDLHVWQVRAFKFQTMKSIWTSQHSVASTPIAAGV